MMPVNVGAALGDHLWQSTLFTAVAALLAFVLRRNQARVRYSLWLIASLKFLVPFSLLTTIGSYLARLPAPVAAPQGISITLQAISEPLTTPAAQSLASHPAQPAATSFLPVLLFAIWLCGSAAVATRWCILWWRIRSAARVGSPLTVGAAIPVLSSRTLFEPGVYGIFRPILLLPEGIVARLTHAQFQAILAHEICHVRRRDNLTSALHMFVEALFWFHPLVWWLGARLVEERELACDEEVLRLGNDAQAYAEGILNTCRYYLGVPLACMSGVTGSNLKQRIARIMSGRAAHRLAFPKKLLLCISAAAAIAGPITFGLINPSASRAQWQPESTPPETFEVASVKPNKSGDRGGWFDYSSGRGFGATNVTLEMLVAEAYSIREFQISGGPGWLQLDRFDIQAKASSPAGQTPKPGEDRQKVDKDRRRRMLQALLADRFGLKIHRETRELPVYALAVSENGPKLHGMTSALEMPKGPGSSSPRAAGIRIGWGHMFGRAVTLRSFTDALSRLVGRTVLDETGLSGLYDFTLDWTPDESHGPMAMASPGAAGPSIFTAVEEQLGLKLESRKGPVEILVIDHAEQPSAN